MFIALFLRSIDGDTDRLARLKEAARNTFVSVLLRCREGHAQV